MGGGAEAEGSTGRWPHTDAGSKQGRRCVGPGAHPKHGATAGEVPSPPLRPAAGQLTGSLGEQDARTTEHPNVREHATGPDGRA